MRERKLDTASRFFFFRIIIIILFVLLIGRLYYLQICRSQRFKRLSEGYRTSIIPISAPRGRIYDKNGEVFVSNKLTYTVSIIPAEVDDVNSLLTKLKVILDLNVEKTIERINKSVDEYSSDKPVRIKRNISREEFIRLEENKNELAGIIIDEAPMREYVYDDLASHLLGYVGEISEGKLKRLKKNGYKTGDLIGKTGLELVYEKYLRGKKGKKLIEVNNLGQKVKTLGVQEPIPGYNLVLNVDYELQKTAEKLLKKKIEELTERAKEDEEIERPPKGGAVIVANIKDSSILAMVSSPNYDPNRFVTGISQQEWEELNNSYREPLLNRAVNTSVPSGSIFKIVTAAAGMEELGVTADTEFYDPGYYKTGGVTFKNWYPVPQEEITFVDAIAWSNNTVFFKLGHQLYKKDKNLLQKYAREFGLGKKTQIDINNEANGLVPDPKWRRENFDRREDRVWYPGYTINLSVGQGNLRTSPIQLLNLVCGVANEGKLYQPLIVDKIVNSEGKTVKDLKPKLLNEIPFSSETFTTIKEGLKGVTSYGTARSAFEDFPISVGGKTGTAQTGRNRPNHGWFAGFAPVDEPEIAVVVFLEYGSSSSNTLSVAKGVLAEYFDLEFDLSEDESDNQSIPQVDDQSNLPIDNQVNEESQNQPSNEQEEKQDD